MQPFWLRVLVYGIPFGVFLALQDCLSGRSNGLGPLIAVLFTGPAFGLAMAFLGQSVHKGMTEAVAELDATGRAEAITAVTAGGVPADSAVRYSAIRLGKAYLRQRTDAQLKRDERIIWLMMPLLVGVTVWLVSTSLNKYEVAFFVVSALLCSVSLLRGIMRLRQIRRNVARLSEGAIPR